MTKASYYRRRRVGGSAPRATSGKTLLVLAVLPAFAAVIVSCMALFATGASFYAKTAVEMQSPEDAIAQRGGGARIYDRNGTLLYQYLDDRYGYETDVKLTDVSPWVQQATIAAEDYSFYDNPGINIRGLARAGAENLKPGDKFLKGSGGSSITQQLVKQLYFTQDERESRSFTRKVREAALAVQVTRDYDKDQILEWYLNVIPYGGLYSGIEAASEGYFALHAKDLSLGQAAFLAGLPQAPSDYDPFSHFDAAKARQGEVLDLMVKHGAVSQQEADWAKLEAIELHSQTQPFLAPHFVLYVGDYIKATMGQDALLHGGLDILTTLDLNLNEQANLILEQNLERYEASSNGHNGSVVIIQPATGQILAMVGSRDFHRDDIAGEVNNAVALNSPGSTLKPFTYATAFMQGWSPEWPIVDTPITYDDGNGQFFSPRNPDGRTRGVITLKQALGNSFNIPAFKTILWVGVDNMVKTAKAMGITTLDRPLGPAVTLGGVDVKLLDMVYGYATFANNGVQAGVPTTQSLPAGNRKLDPNPVLVVKNRAGKVLMDNTTPKLDFVIKPEYAYMITSILSNDENRQITYGVGSNLNIPGWRVAAKTGTSEPYENSRLIGDTWTFGYTPDIAVGVWAGNSDNSPMVNILSTTIAGATWHDVMVAALRGKQPRDFVTPDGIVRATVCVPSGRVAGPNDNCPRVTGAFAADALAQQNDHWWGAQQIGAAAPSLGASGVPEEVTGYKRQLANEYLGAFRGASSPTIPPQELSPQPGTAPPAAASPAPAPQPAAPAAQQPVAPPAQPPTLTVAVPPTPVPTRQPVPTAPPRPTAPVAPTPGRR